MKIVINVPKEFESHFERDRFNESMCRLRADAHCVAGNYEKELCDMLIEAFKNGTSFPEGREYTDEIVKALEKEPCEDAISRQAALQCCRNEWEEEVETRLKSLPPVTSQQKYEDIAKAFQFGLGFGFCAKHDEMVRVINEIKKVTKVTRDCKTCGHSKDGKCSYTEECHDCMWESKYIKVDKEIDNECND